VLETARDQRIPTWMAADRLAERRLAGKAARNGKR